MPSWFKRLIPECLDPYFFIPDCCLPYELQRERFKKRLFGKDYAKPYKMTPEDLERKARVIKWLYLMPVDDFFERLDNDDLVVSLFTLYFVATIKPKEIPTVIDRKHPALKPDKKGRCYINELPDEILQKILKSLSIYDQEPIRKVCHRWNEFLVPLSQIHRFYHIFARESKLKLNPRKTRKLRKQQKGKENREFRRRAPLAYSPSMLPIHF